MSDDGEILSRPTRWEIDALLLLSGREVWPVDKLPNTVDADLLRCLDERGWVEARYIVMQNQQKFPGDPTPPAPSPSEWFSPLKQPRIVGNWDKFLTRPQSDEGRCLNEVRVSETGKAILARLHREVAANRSANVAALLYDRLLITLNACGATGVAVMDLPAELRDAELLTVMDADGLIRFGRRNHCYVGPVNPSELRLEKGWTFRSVTTDQSKPITDWLTDLANEPSDSPIRHHVCLTANGRIEASRLALSRRDAVGGESDSVPALLQGDADSQASYMPAHWFRDKFGIPSSRLRAARRDGRLHAIDKGTKRPLYHYSVPDAVRLWPDDGIYLPETGD